MDGRVVLVTGANGKIGSAICKNLISKGASLVLVCRQIDKAQNLKEQLKHYIVNNELQTIQCEEVDLSNEESISTLAELYKAQGNPLHVIINNAAECPRQRETVAGGFERQFATNVLSYYWVTCSFSDILQKSAKLYGAPSRVVMVASYWAGGLDFSDLQFQYKPYDNDEAYRQSKQADRMLAKGFSKIFQSDLLTVNSCHPGDVDSKLSGDLGFSGYETPEKAAETPVWLASNENVTYTGEYFQSMHECPCKFSKNTHEVSKLMGICKKVSKLISLDKISFKC